MGFFSSVINVALSPVRVVSSTVGGLADVLEGKPVIRSADKALRKVVLPREGEFATVDRDGNLNIESDVDSDD